MGALFEEEKTSVEELKTPVPDLNNLTLKSTVKRLTRSLEDINKCDITRVSEDDEDNSYSNDNESTSNTNDESGNDDSDGICKSKSSKNQSNEFVSDFADVSEVANTMASLLNDGKSNKLIFCLNNFEKSQAKIILKI
jgi:hypothetical protein